MTRTANARLAGATYLLYIAVAAPGIAVSARATRGADTAAKLASVAAHTGDMRLGILISFATAVVALSLAIALHGITRDEDRDLSLLALFFRGGEGLANAMTVIPSLALMHVASNASAPGAIALGSVLLASGDWITIVGSWLFASGSTIFCWLLLRGRAIPTWLAWLGVFGSALLVVTIPARALGVPLGAVNTLQWVPIALFEVTVAVYFLWKGVREPVSS